MVGEKQRRALPLTDTVLITAHGISHKERDRLEAGRQAAHRHDLPAGDARP